MHHQTKFKIILPAFFFTLFLVASVFAQTKISKQVKTEADKFFIEAIALVGEETVGSYRAALQKLEKAARIYRKNGYKKEEANCLFWSGTINYDLGENEKSLNFYNQALNLRKLAGDKIDEADVLYKIGIVYEELKKKTMAIDFYNQARSLYKVLNDREMQLRCLYSILSIFEDSGENLQSIKYYKLLLEDDEQIDQSGKATILNNIGLNYLNLGKNQEAIEYYAQAQIIYKSIGDKNGEAVTLNNFGLTYWYLGDYKKALCLFNQSLSLRKTSPNSNKEADTLNNIGLVYDDSGEKQMALEFYSKSLTIKRSIGDKIGQARTLNNIGTLYRDSGENQKALEFYNKALEIEKEISEKRLMGVTLSSIGRYYYLSGEKQKALNFYYQALPLQQSSADTVIEANTLNWLGQIWLGLGNPRLAIFYGKQSVNKYQELRQNISGLDKNTQKTYLKKIENVYRQLADILIAQGRIAEAEQVLDMLKEDEYFSYLRRDDKVAADLKSRISLSADEKKAFEEYEKYADEITRTAQEFEALKKKIPFGGTVTSLSADEQKRYKELENQYNAAVTVFNKFLDDLRIRFGKTDVRVEKIESDTIGLLKSLNQPRTVIISTIVGEDRLNLIVTTSEVQRAHTVEIKAADLNKLVAEFREAVKNPAIDPRPLGKRLYDTLFPADLQKDLTNIKADTIVWSLDGTLRYVPMSALWDGEKYLVERYANAIITLASRDKLGSGNNDRRSWTAFGVGVSKQFENFEALPAVPKELCSVVKDTKKTDFCGKLGETGIFSGLMLSDEEFTLELFQPNLGKTSLVHIASHFALNPGEYDASFLLLGGGTNRRFSLETLRKTRLDGVELLTLSACNTAMTPGNQTNGLEVEGFGALAQKQGVKSVLATLWSVADDSTGAMMTEFYRQMQTDTQIGKAEALRQTQIKMINGKIKPTSANSGCRSGVYKPNGNTETAYKCDANTPFSHPFYWSPFILFGNWR